MSGAATYLYTTIYDDADPLTRSDQVTVPAEFWMRMDRGHVGPGPIYVELGGFGSGVVGRLRPAVPSDGLTGDMCRIPHWMWMRLGCPIEEEGDDAMTEVAVRELPVAGSIVLRARREVTLTSSEDPVAMLTEGISSGWATLCAGAELPLACGVFDVMEVRSTEGHHVAAAIVLDTDVNLELVQALDHCPPAPPVAPVVNAPIVPPLHNRRTGFTPFSGTGYRLG
jgi:hypothetical protein